VAVGGGSSSSYSSSSTTVTSSSSSSSSTTVIGGSSSVSITGSVTISGGGGVVTGGGSVPGKDECYGSKDKDAFNNCVLKLTNLKRHQHLAGPLELDDRLKRSAQKYADFLASKATI
jgi:uncharacterized protein YkwD